MKDTVKDTVDDLPPDLLLMLNAFMSERAVMRVTSLSRTSLHRKRLAGIFPESLTEKELSDFSDL